MQPIHRLTTTEPKPQRFTYPFCYTPHPLAVEASEQVKRAVAANEEWLAEAERGKMFGVLVVEDGDGLAFLAAYSGLFCGRNGWEYFVPPVYDLLRPDGHFQEKEKEISDINLRISELEKSEGLTEAKERLAAIRLEAEAEESCFRTRMNEAKAARDKIRNGEGTAGNDTPDAETLIRESQFLKAELRRIRKRNSEAIAEAQGMVEEQEKAIEQLKKLRRDMSEELQAWLFSQFSMLNAKGERRDLCDIFSETVSKTPPSGAGECCAPKLLQYAYLHGLHPVCMAEFWWGESPKSEIRHHWQYYPSCRGKCLPILTHMLQGLDVDPDPQSKGEGDIIIVYEDEDIIVVNKPSGLLSVPGRSDRPSVYSILQERFPKNTELTLAHRLDMDTSGLLVAGKTAEAYKNLQAQFLDRTVKKRYHAIITDNEGRWKEGDRGVIRLPIRPDPSDRPRQVADHIDGKPAITEYRIDKVENGLAAVTLIPHTGRTHQLRLHCAHQEGLGCPILGDPLYGISTEQQAEENTHHSDGERLHLHAAHLSFIHPSTRKRMYFDSKEKMG